MTDDRAGLRGAIGQAAAEAALGLHDHGWKKIGDALMRQGVGAGERLAVKQIAKTPTRIYQATQVLSAPDKTRAIVGLVGGVAGGALGGAGGSVAGPIGSFAGEVAGSNAGQAGAEYLYDHRGDIADWMKARRNDLGRAAVARLQPYLPPGLALD